jgi:hypothetical protein
VFEDLFYDIFGLNESDDGHRPMAFGTRQGIDFIDFLYHPCPVLAVPLGWFIGLQDAREQSVLVYLLALTPTDVAVVAIVTNHLLTLVRDMGAHGCQPLQGIKDILLFSVFGPVKDLGFLRNIGHSLLGKGGADDIPGQVFNCKVP